MKVALVLHRLLPHHPPTLTPVQLSRYVQRVVRQPIARAGDGSGTSFSGFTGCYAAKVV